MTRRSFMTAFCVAISQHGVTAQARLERDSPDGSNEIPRPEGFILTGLLKRATDGSDSWTIGRTYVGMPPESPLVPSTTALENVRVRLTLERAD
jgi:hypothetical protein